MLDQIAITEMNSMSTVTLCIRHISVDEVFKHCAVYTVITPYMLNIVYSFISVGESRHYDGQ